MPLLLCCADGRKNCGGRLLGPINGVHRRLWTDMRPDPLHLAHCINAEVAQTAIVPLPAATAQPIGLVIGQLNHPHPEGEAF